MKDQSLLEKHSIRSTSPRREILRAISSLKKRHFSAEDLLQFIEKKKRGVSRASTYRTIKLFSQKGLIKPIELVKDYQMYELADEEKHHDHLYCIECGKIIEFEDKNIEKLQDKVCQGRSFYPLRHTLKIIGSCKECR